MLSVLRKPLSSRLPTSLSSINVLAPVPTSGVSKLQQPQQSQPTPTGHSDTPHNTWDMQENKLFGHASNNITNTESVKIDRSSTHTPLPAPTSVPMSAFIAAAAFPYPLSCSSSTLSRRTSQLADAQTQLRNLQAEIDLYATKMMRMAQIAADPRFSHTHSAQAVARALAGDTQNGIDTLEANIR